ncbi:hypothetical protein JHK85_007148 [Glycine max]|nr:hypothetical protein JHK85_007148 [Glycine max]KAG5071744.1 hypothetical protein JHK86_006955 [Glycine max]
MEDIVHKTWKKVQAHNLYPHTLSRGGNDGLREKMMPNKIKQLEEASQSDPLLVVHPPSPAKFH